MKHLLIRCVVAMLVLHSPAWAAWPEKPLRIIVPTTAGGAADTLARMVASRLSDKFGQPVVVENRPGGSTSIGMRALAQTAPDGYTLGMTFAGSMSINPVLYRSLSYDPVREFAPVAIVAVSPLVITVSPKLGVQDLHAFLARARQEPGKLSFGSSSTGSTQHLSMELLKATAQVDMLHVPYKGSAGAIIDLQAGLISSVSENAITVIPHIQGGRLQALAVGTKQRLDSLPDVPTIAEVLGLPDYEAVGWYGLVAPAGVPAAIIDTLNAALADILGEPSFIQWLQGQGMQSRIDSAAGFGAYIAAERRKWARVIATAGVELLEMR